MAFWKIGNGFNNTSEIDKLLDSDDCTLISILEKPEILTELSTPNAKLVEYLREPEVLKELVGLVTDVNLAISEDTQSIPDNQNEESNQSHDDSNDTNNIISFFKDKSTDEVNENEDNDNKNIDPNSATHSENTTHNNDSNEKTNLTTADDEDDDYKDDDEDPNNMDGERSYFDDDSRHHFANIACEILCAGIWSITEALMENTELVEEIWAILDYPSPLSLAHSTYFTKISEHLLDKKTEELTAFIKQQDNFVKRFMKHIDNPPVMDFLLKVISSDKPDNPSGIIEFLQYQKLIPSLISFLGPDYSSSVHSAAGDFLKAFVTISANSNSDNTTIGPNELSRELVSEKCIRELVRLMLFGGSGLSTGVGVVIELIRKNNSDYDFVPLLYTTIETHPPNPRDPIYLGRLVKIFSENITKFNDMLTKKHDEILKTPFGQIEPLGFERFKICELVAELLHCSNMALLNDSNGEVVVRARDKERIRVQRELAEQTGSYPPLDYFEDEEESDAQEELDNISKEDQSKGPSTDFTPGDFEEENTKFSEVKEAEKPTETAKSDDDDVDDDDVLEPLTEDLGNLSLQRTHHTDQPEVEPLPTEESLRENPVVGDQLKIALIDTQVIVYILNMFFQFPWNNFLHNVVFDIVQQVFNGPMAQGYNRFLAIDLFERGRLTHLICKGQTDCVEYQAAHKSRLGYMGHLTLISEEVVKFTATFPPETISSVVEEAIQDPEWENYVSEILTKTREKYSTVLGGVNELDSNDELDRNGQYGSSDINNDNNGGLEEDDNHYGELGGDDMGVQQGSNGQGDTEGSGPFFRYVSEQMTVGSQFGSSDEDDEDEDDDVRQPGHQSYGDSSVQLLGSDDDTEDDSGLDLVRSKSNH